MSEKFADYVNKLKSYMEAKVVEKKDVSVQTINDDKEYQQKDCEYENIIECENEITPREQESVQNSQRKSKCRYWKKGFCLKGDHCSWYHSDQNCFKYIERGNCTKRNCNKRHRQICRYWQNKKKGCRRGTSCQYLHQELNKDKCNKSYNNKKEDYEHKNNIDIDIPFEDLVRETVLKILREMRYKEGTIEDDFDCEYGYKETDDEVDKEEEKDPAGGAVSH